MFMKPTSIWNKSNEHTTISLVKSEDCLAFRIIYHTYSPLRRAQWFKSEFAKLGISSSTQDYSYSTSIGVCRENEVF